MRNRVGLGFDVHPFGDEPPLVLGGVRIPDAPRRAWRQLWRRSATEGRGTVADGCVNPATRTLLAIVRSAER